MNLNDILHPTKRQAYADHLKQAGYSDATINRKQASLNQLQTWAAERGYVQQTELISPPPSVPFYKRISPKSLALAGTTLVGLMAVVLFLLRFNLPGSL